MFETILQSKLPEKFDKPNGKNSQVAWVKSTLTKDYVCLKPMEEYRDMPVDGNSAQRRQRRSYKLPRSEPQLQNTQRLTFEFRNFLSLKRKTPSLAGSRILRMDFVIPTLIIQEGLSHENKGYRCVVDLRQRNARTKKPPTHGSRTGRNVG